MKYTSEIVIHLPLKRVVELFDNVDNMAKWQPGLVSYEQLSGVPGQPGAKMKLSYKMGKRKIDMIETITKNDLPRELAGTYEAKGVFNIISNRFEELGSDKTKWVSENEFRFKGFMILMGKLMPGAFKKESYKHMEQFKAFAEAEELQIQPSQSLSS